MAKDLIEPRILKGFRDYLPREMIIRRRMIETLERVFISFGFVPIDTPAIELTEILLGKGSAETDKQLYRFLDNGERDVALRFDLTVPLARFVAEHRHELGMPFKRYHIAPVWRAEKPQRGRYREFFQCDFDIIGSYSVFADAEIAAVIHHSLAALGINHTVRINNRLILNGLLESIGARERSATVLRTIDKLDKLGKAKVADELQMEASLDSDQIERIFSFLSLSTKISDERSILEELKVFFANNKTALTGVEQLQSIFDCLPALGVSKDRACLDLSIARGLDYYTGTVFETTCVDLPQIGSICSGGRYDNLASLYTSEELPGVGASVGLDRIIGALEELGRVADVYSTAQVLMTIIEPDAHLKCLEIANLLRHEGIAVETFPEQKKLAAQLKYADRKKIRIALIAGMNELRNNRCSIKLLESGIQMEESLDRLPAKIRELLGKTP